MTHTFSIVPKRQFESFKEGFVQLGIFAIVITFLLLTNYIALDNPTLLYFFIGFYIFFCLPAIYLHVSYFFENKNTVVTVDTFTKQVTIQNEGTESFTFSEIKTIEQHLGNYYKNKHDGRAKRKTSWSNYGYLKLTLNNGKSFYLSSLMLDPFSFPIKSTKTRYRFIPYLEKQEITFKQKRNWAEIERREKVDKYISNFSNFSTETLEGKLSDTKRYQPEAIEAVNRILEQRKVDYKD